MARASQRTGTGMRAVLYARVSSEEQARRESIETQIHFARQQCERDGIALGEIYKDEGVSGTVPFENRPGGRRLLADARAGKFDLCLLYRVDRLGRVDVVSHVALHHLEAVGVGLRSLTEPFDTSTPSGKFLFSILVANSALERSTIRQRTKDGLRRVAQTGLWANGRPPYGYQIVEHQLMPYEPEAAVVKDIFALAMKREPLVAIAKHLNARGIPTREGKLWRFASVARIIHRTAYRGEHAWGIGKNRITRPCPPLVSEKIWHGAQEALRLNAKACRGNTKHRDFLLKSLARCGFCERSLTGVTTVTTATKYHFYRCNAKADPDRTAPCPGRYPEAAWLEGLVWDTLADWILRRGDLDRALADALREQAEERKETAHTLAHVRQQLAAKEAEHDRVVGAFRRGLISEDDLARQLSEIDQEQHRLRETIDALAEGTPPIDPARLAEQIGRQLDRYRRALQTGHLSFVQKRHIVEAFVESVRVRLPKGQTLSGRVREVIPYRDGVPKMAAIGTGEVLWQRGPRQAPALRPSVEVLYRFPWPQTAPGMIIDFPSVERRSNTKTSSATRA
jgi:site-specific DNA recombinase